jgi:ubiquinone/menaquinone biosynthesis C-methylase UbiE
MERGTKSYINIDNISFENVAVQQLFVDCRKVYDLINTLIEFGVVMMS